MLNVQKSILLIAGMFTCLTAQAMHLLEEKNKKEPAWKDYNLFRVVQRVREIVEEERLESKKRGLPIDSFEMSGHHKEWIRPFYGFGTTTKGLSFKGMRELWTPWGIVPLIGKVDYKTWFSKGYIAFQLSVLKRMKTKFIRVDSSGLTLMNPLLFAAWGKKVDLGVLCRENNGLGDIWRPIAEEQLKEMEGEEIFFWSDNDFEFYYGISEVEGYKLPDSDPNDFLRRSSYEEVKEVLGSWQKMEKRFKEEKKLSQMTTP